MRHFGSSANWGTLESTGESPGKEEQNGVPLRDTRRAEEGEVVLVQVMDGGTPLYVGLSFRYGTARGSSVALGIVAGPTLICQDFGPSRSG